MDLEVPQSRSNAAKEGLTRLSSFLETSNNAHLMVNLYIAFQRGKISTPRGQIKSPLGGTNQSSGIPQNYFTQKLCIGQM